MKTIEFKGKRNHNLVVRVTYTPDFRITKIENETGIMFPYKEGQILNRSVEVWACFNNFFMDGKDTCPINKVMGIKVTDIPQGHELRLLFPKKFKK